MYPSLRPFNEAVLEKSFDWLSDPEVKFLTATPDLSRDKQAAWFKSLPARSDYMLKAVFYKDSPIGVAGLKNVSTANKTGEYFGYIGDKTYWGKGIGRWMLAETLKTAVGLGLDKVYLQVIVENYKAINLYFSLGFRINSLTEGKYNMEKPCK